MTQRTKIAIVMACFNRSKTTLRCLESIALQSSDLVDVSVHLLDDASSDGTASAVRAAFPSVNVIEGDGHRYWGGGMHLAMRSAAATDFDFILWLNDDVVLWPGALSKLLMAHERAVLEHGPGLHVIVGAVEDPQTGAIAYAGFKRRNGWHPAHLDPVFPKIDQLVACDTMNGNCVLISSAVVEAVGLIDAAFIQQIGDIDYGYRVTFAGGSVWLAPGSSGTCEPNLRQNRWKDPELSFKSRLRLLQSPLGLPIRPWITFFYRYAGVIAPLLLFASYYKALSIRRESK